MGIHLLSEIMFRAQGISPQGAFPPGMPSARLYDTTKPPFVQVGSSLHQGPVQVA